MDERKIRARLEAERERLLGVRRDLRGDPETAADLASVGELSNYGQHPGDIGSEVFEHEQNASILEQVETQLKEAEAAFDRLAKGSYGSCEACGEPIGAARLEERPFARFCLDDQRRVERDAGLPGTTA